MRRSLFTACLLAAASAAIAAPVRVGLFQKELPDHFWVSAASGLKIFDAQSRKCVLQLPSGEAAAFAKEGDQIHLTTREGFSAQRSGLRVETQKPGDPLLVGTERMPERPYSGTLDIQAAPRELQAINEISEDDYLTAVVAAEMPAGWPAEALKAQAVVARTYLRQNPHRHRSTGYEVCDLAHCQVYQGASRGNSKVRLAVQETKNEVLTLHGRLIEAVFHSACGGHTASNEDVWGGTARSYLRAQTDSGGIKDYCQGSPDYRWTITIDKSSLAELLRPVFPDHEEPGVFRSLSIASRDSSGRVKTLSVQFSNASKTITAYTLYLLWGRSTRWHELKSTWFDLSTWNDHYEFRGKGLGHGLGMCQWGAHGRALDGSTYRDILAHYFPDTQIERQDH